MAGILGSGGKKSNWYGLSDGTRDVKSPSSWNAGKPGPHKRKNKDHKARTGKAAFRKAKHHYGSMSQG